MTTATHVQTAQNPKPISLIQPPPPITVQHAPRLESAASQAVAESSRTEGDLELSRQYGRALASAPSGYNSDMPVSPIAPHSTFGQWWAQLRHAFQAPDFAQWMNSKDIDPDSVELNPGTGKIFYKLKRHSDPRQIKRSLGKDDAEWAAIGKPLMIAARVIASGAYFLTFKPPQAKTSNIAPLGLIRDFYKELHINPAPSNQERAAQLEAGAGFQLVNDPVFSALQEARSEHELAAHKAMLGSNQTRLNVVELMTSLAKMLESGPADIPEYMAEYHLSVHRDTHNVHAGTTPTLKQFFESEGWEVPTDLAQVQNLIKKLRTPPLQSPPNGNYGGALAWPVALDETSVTQLEADLRHGKFGDIDLTRFKNVLEYLMDGQFIEPSAFNKPRDLIDTRIKSPKGQALGQAVQAKFAARSVKGTLTEWLFTLMHVDSSRAEHGKHQVAGFLLTDARNGGCSASDLILDITNHLLDTGQSSSYEKARLQAYIYLSVKAPEMLVKEIPNEVKFGTHMWVSLVTAVRRLEKAAPGVTATMTYEHVMRIADIAPITQEERLTECLAQQEALKDWAVVNGMDCPQTAEAMRAVQVAFDQQLNELRAASAAHSMEVPDVKRKGLEELKKAFPDMDPALFEKKCIQLKRQHLDFPGPYSVLDLYIHDAARGTPGFYDGITRDQADSANKWVSTSRDVDFDAMQDTLKSLPNLREYFRVAFPNYSDKINRSVATQVKHLIAGLSLSDRQNFEFGKITLAKPVIHEYWPYSQAPKSSTTVSEGHSFLVRTERAGKVNIYEIDIKQNKIRTRDDLGDFVVGEARPRGVSRYTEYQAVIPSGNYADTITDETKGAAGIPLSFSSERTSYIANAMVKEVDTESSRQLAAGQTTFDVEVPFYKNAMEFMLNLIPLRSAINNFKEGRYGDGIVDLTLDAFGFLLGAAGAAKGIKALQGGASILTKAAYGGKILGRTAIGALNPLDGVGDLAISLANAGKKGSTHAYRLLRGTNSYDLINASKRFDASALGTFKLQDTIMEGPAVLSGGKWYAFDSVKGLPFGKALDDFQPSVLSGEQALGKWETTERVMTPASARTRQRWSEMVERHQNAADKTQFQKGYDNGDPKSVPGYRAAMKSEDIMKLATQGQLTPEQIGTLVRHVERLAVQHGFKGVNRFYESISEAGGRFVAAPQVFYLSQTNPLSQGQCSAMSRLMASAMQQGTEAKFIGNLYTAAANPTDPASRAFIDQLTTVQKQLTGPTLFHAGKMRREMGYHEMLDELATSDTPKTLMIGIPGHAMMAGVMGEGVNKKWFFYDPNFGIATFSTPEAMKRGLHKVFTDKDLPVQYTTHSKNPDKLEFEVSVYDDSWKKTTAVSDKTVKELSEMPIVIKSQTATSVPMPSKPVPPHAPITTGKAEKFEVFTGQSHTVNDRTTVLSTNGLSDCSAVVVLSDMKDGIYQKRTLVHLNESNLAQPVNNGSNGFTWLNGVEKDLANGGKVIFVAGTRTRSVVGVASAIRQQDVYNNKPLLAMLQRKDVSVTYANSVGVEVAPDGTFKLRDDGGEGIFDANKVKEILDLARD
ncbi:hypothetical protein [Pseudomonas sp. NFPP24]|uniref:hypothetical protein n=1 Tax=Pseudomonas sp. NFPP24 TaxID=1566228 RepID=UPI0008EEB14A|nr:hypothetical protein [Pseudomonas sp. NFPP24]SFB44447.1 hypothetical protein SAMN03159485_05649 [Pseudomonas sp. NFPP24]